MKKNDEINPRTAKKIIKKIRKKEPYSGLFKKAVKRIWNSCVKDNGWWSYRDLDNELLVSVYYQLLFRKTTFHSRLNRDFRYSYEAFLLKDSVESDEELRQIISNARSRTKDRYLTEIGKERKGQKQIEREFNEAYGDRPKKEQKAIKRGRRSGLNRYRPRINITIGFSLSSISDNTYGRFQDLELEGVLQEGLNSSDIILLNQICRMSDDEIACELNINVESVKRKKRRLKEKIKKLIQS